MTSLQQIVQTQVDEGGVPGAVALVADVDDPVDVQVGVAGQRSVDGDEPMRRDTIFRVASITKPIVAAATMVLIDRGRLAIDDPVARWLPELATPMVLRDPAGPLDDVVAADRPITVRHLLTSTCGLGFPPDFSWPVVQVLLDGLHQGAPETGGPNPDEWIARLAEVPLIAQPGQRFLYNTSLDVLGLLLARVEASSLGEVLTETLLDPLGMDDTAFWAGATRVERMAAQHDRTDDGFVVVDPPDGRWIQPPGFESGSGGLLSTVDDWLAFGRMLLSGGVGPDGHRLLSEASVAAMTTSHVEAEPDNPFLDGQGWGYGGGVDLTAAQPWNVPGRYGWIGGTGTAGYVIPSRGRITVWLSQVSMAGPADFTSIAAFLTWAAQR